ncbi:putative D,D-dipeptide-binding periplasmic protein DdpA precursor [Streptomyces sp. YIM 130001]|uniref:ABC transporter substrate-binding protein n=1 Tax=Streptomyces sp. YIM 130001 TaxID=2259644 RepID=UPI000E64BA20|nr:ABC transporter substrate-binding protein [Streptomyces sp. YIM 130001]RII20199.1 putative D,D-dipeptide-binding periplasmic protein DdpA precursor [Streptomyces sp. YIM 130001]
MTTTRTAAVAWLAALALLTATGCSGADRPAGDRAPADAAKLDLTATTPAAEDALAKANWLLEDEPDSLDLDAQGTSAGRIVLTNVCERLYQLQPDMSTKPHLAEKGQASADGKTLTLGLRDDVTFHDGSKMTADDVLWSLKRHADPDMEQADEFENVAAMEKTGEHEITVRFKEPDALFLKALAGDAGIVWNKARVRESGKEFGTPGQPDACSGPYELTRWDSGDSITIRAHDAYWGEQPLTREVVFKWATDSALVNALKTGAADGAYAESPNTAAALRGDKGLSQYYGPSTASLVLIPTARGGMQDDRIRHALSLALDRKGIAESGFGGLVQPWASPVGSGAWGYEKDTFAAAQKKLAAGAPASPDADDLAEAKRLVKESGAPTEPVVIGTDASQGRTVTANAVRAALQRIGLKGEIKTVPTAQFEEFYSDEQARGDIDLLVGDWYISKADPVGFYDNGLSTSPNNWVGFKDAAYDRLVKKALGTLDDTERAGLATDIQQRFVEAAVWIPVAQVPTILVLDSELTGPTSSQAYLYYPWAAGLGKKKAG